MKCRWKRLDFGFLFFLLSTLYFSPSEVIVLPGGELKLSSDGGWCRCCNGKRLWHAGWAFVDINEHVHPNNKACYPYIVHADRFELSLCPCIERFWFWSCKSWSNNTKDNLQETCSIRKAGMYNRPLWYLTCTYKLCLLSTRPTNLPSTLTLLSPFCQETLKCELCCTDVAFALNQFCE